MKEGLYTKKLKADRVICSLCHHQCLISPDARGLCEVRENKSGKVYALNFEKVTKEEIIPIERVLKHFLPGTDTYTVGTVGENFKVNEPELAAKKATALQVVKRADKEELFSITFMYNEPTMSFEMLVDAGKQARSKRLKAALQTNLYVQERGMKELLKTMHAFSVTLPSADKELFSHITGAKLFPVQKNIQLLLEEKAWLEIWTTVTEENRQLGNLQGIANYIASLDKNIPWIIETQDTALLQSAKELGKQAGLLNVYGHKESLACAHCKKELLDKENLYVDKGACEFCHKPVLGVF